MNLSAPKMWTFVIAVILWIIGLVGAFYEPLQAVAFLNMSWAFWSAMLGGLILAIGNLYEGI